MKILKTHLIVALIAGLVCGATHANSSDEKAAGNLSKQAKESALLAVNEWLFSPDHTNTKQRVMVDMHLNTRMALDGLKPINKELPINNESKLGKGYWYKLWESMGYDYPSMYKLELRMDK